MSQIVTKVVPVELDPPLVIDMRCDSSHIVLVASGRHSEATVPHDDRSDALADGTFCAAKCQQRQVRMRVNVNEPWCDSEAGGIDGDRVGSVDLSIDRCDSR